MNQPAHDIEENRAMAARVAGCAELADIRLLSAACDLRHFADGRNLASDQSVDIRLNGPEAGENTFIVDVTWTVDISYAEPLEDDGDLDPTRVRCQFGALYGVPDDFSATLDQYQAFAQSIGLLAIYPYAREIVQNLTVRMGLPPLTLPVLRQPLPPQYEEVAADAGYATDT